MQVSDKVRTATTDSYLVTGMHTISVRQMTPLGLTKLFEGILCLWTLPLERSGCRGSVRL